MLHPRKTLNWWPLTNYFDLLNLSRNYTENSSDVPSLFFNISTLKRFIITSWRSGSQRYPKFATVAVNILWKDEHILCASFSEQSICSRSYESQTKQSTLTIPSNKQAYHSTKRVFMLRQCPFLHIHYISTSRVPMPNYVCPKDAIWLHNTYSVKLKSSCLINPLISVSPWSSRSV